MTFIGLYFFYVQNIFVHRDGLGKQAGNFRHFYRFFIKTPFVSLQSNYGQICLYGGVYELRYWSIMEAIIMWP